jgi:Ribonuclease G/E
MPKKIVISDFNNIGAIVYNNKIQEIFSINSNYQVNDIYLGSIHKIFSSINAAFVNLGSNKKNGFIHINDIKFLKKTFKFTQITDILSIKQLLLVQVIKH